MVQGLTGPTGATGATGATGDKGDKGNTGDSGGFLKSNDAGTAVLNVLIGVMTGIASSLIQDAIFTALGFLTLTALQAQMAGIEAQLLQVTGFLSLAQASITELQANNALLQTQIEQLQAKIINISCTGQNTTVYGSFEVFNPFGTNIMQGDLNVIGKITSQNLTMGQDKRLSVDLLQFN
jgi:hypothetical protein